MCIYLSVDPVAVVAEYEAGEVGEFLGGSEPTRRVVLLLRLLEAPGRVQPAEGALQAQAQC